MNVELDPKTRINWKRFKGIVRGTVNGMIPVAIACAVVGIITGVVMATGIAFRLSSILLDLAGGRMFLLPFMAMPLTRRTLAAATRTYLSAPDSPPWRGLERASGGIHLIFGILYALAFVAAAR